MDAFFFSLCINNTLLNTLLGYLVERTVPLIVFQGNARVIYVNLSSNTCLRNNKIKGGPLMANSLYR